ncbi:MAG: phage tail protein [Pseudomonadota bacterium]|nr:phage tail protein [Pseudomonadota bacterium]
MSDQFLAEIRIFPFNFAPTGWLQCNGQLLPISQYAALFSLIGTYYGGNGTSNFQLPNLQGRAPVDQGAGPGLSIYNVGDSAGTPTIALTAAESGVHSHTLNADNEIATSPSPSNAIYMQGHWAVSSTSKGQIAAYSAQPPNSNLNAGAIASAGSGQPHNNMMPYLAVNFCIAINGIFPSRG